MVIGVIRGVACIVGGFRVMNEGARRSVFKGFSSLIVHVHGPSRLQSLMLRGLFTTPSSNTGCGR